MKKFVFQYGGHFEFQVVASQAHISKMATIENRIRLNFLKILMYRTTLQHKISHGLFVKTFPNQLGTDDLNNDYGITMRSRASSYLFNNSAKL